MKNVRVIWRIFLDFSMMCIILLLLMTTYGRFESYAISLLGLIYYSLYGIFLQSVLEREFMGFQLSAHIFHIKQILLEKRGPKDKLEIPDFEHLDNVSGDIFKNEFIGNTEEERQAYMANSLRQIAKRIQDDQKILASRSLIFLTAMAACVIKIIWTLLI